MTSLDDSVRKFKGYCNGENGFDELDFKAEVWEFIQSTCLDVTGADEQDRNRKQFLATGDIKPLIKSTTTIARNTLRAEQTTKLSERMNNG